MFRTGISSRPLCPECTNPIKLSPGHHQYGITCSRKCAMSLARKQGLLTARSIKGRQTKERLYGPDHDRRVAQKARKTMLERYGVENALKSDIFMAKKNETMVDRHGGINALRLDEFRHKHKTKLSNRSKEIVEEALSEVDRIHGQRYQYLNRDVIGSINDKIVYICPQHGEISQILRLHAQGRKCHKCSAAEFGLTVRGTTEDFISKSKAIHDDKYDYHKVRYSTAYDEVEIICPNHGSFFQIPNYHLSGNGCQKCGLSISRGEDELYKFICDLGITAVQRDRSQIGPKELDIWIPDYSLAIEFCGLIWHSDKFNNNPNHLLEKHEQCKEKNIRLLTIFEDEWTYQSDKVKATLRHLLGLSERGIPGRKTTIREIDWATTKAFLNRHHLLNSGPACSHRLGAFDPYDNLIAVMTFGTPSDERGRTDLVEMKRYVCDGRNHPGLASKMFKHAITLWNFPQVSAFVDRRWFTGEFKSIAGFNVIGTTRPSLFWVRHGDRYHRRFVTKKQLNNPQYAGLSKREILARMKFYRIWDCGKYKMMWVK